MASSKQVRVHLLPAARTEVIHTADAANATAFADVWNHRAQIEQTGQIAFADVYGILRTATAKGKGRPTHAK